MGSPTLAAGLESAHLVRHAVLEAPRPVPPREVRRADGRGVGGRIAHGSGEVVHQIVRAIAGQHIENRMHVAIFVIDVRPDQVRRQLAANVVRSVCHPIIGMSGVNKKKTEHDSGN